ncbi:hypothetical protein ACCO45_003373 [Purpureocillium lilacinum]|uniref:Uncharacterized protein n=1 Tax=Purpureocillium lilacinum TaxID=33203 RepID=A0ACC4E2J0_PURLI
MCLPNLFSRKQTQDHPHEETTPQPSPAQQPTGRRTAEATARLDKSRFSSTRRPRRGSSEKNQAGADYTPGGHAASSPSTGGPEGQHGGIYGGVQGVCIRDLSHSTRPIHAVRFHHKPITSKAEDCNMRCSEKKLSDRIDLAAAATDSVTGGAFVLSTLAGFIADT